MVLGFCSHLVGAQSTNQPNFDFDYKSTMACVGGRGGLH